MNIRPSTFDEIVGQEQVKQVCKTLIKASQIDDSAIPHILFSGPAGTGKTTFGRSLAHERGVVFHPFNGTVVKSEKDMKLLLSNLQDNDIMFIDEIHNLSNRVAEFMYTVMEDFIYFDKGHMGESKSVQIPKFTLVGASTQIGTLPKPFKDRFPYTAEFVEYSLSELVEIVYRVCTYYGFKLNKNIAEVIAKTCRNTPRIVVNRTKWVRQFMLANRLTKISKNDLVKIIALQGVDEQGLTRIDRAYIDELKLNGATSIKQLSSRLSIDEQTILNDIEPYLIKLGKVKISKGKGRYV